MNWITATQAKNRFGDILTQAIQDVIGIIKSGKHVAVIMSLTEYERLNAIEDAYWGLKAQRAEQSGFMGSEESMNFIQTRLKQIKES